MIAPSLLLTNSISIIILSLIKSLILKFWILSVRECPRHDEWVSETWR